MVNFTSLLSLKKILYISANGYLGGAENVVITAASGHLISGHYSPTILFFHDGEAVKLAKDKGIECLVLKSQFKLSSPLSLFKALREIRGILRDNPTKIIHSTMAYVHLVMSLATLGMPQRKVWFQHGPVGGLLDKLACLFGVDVLFFNSNYLKDLHHQSFPHSKIKVGEKVVPLGIGSGPSHPLFNKGQLIFGAAGRICEGKAFDKIISAIVQTDLPFTLLIAGGPKTENDISYFKSLQNQTSYLRQEQNVLFLGHQENMRDFYQQIDVFIHASIAPEPFGLVTAEAMAHGCLVVARNEGGAKDIIIPNETGLNYSHLYELSPLLKSLLQQKETEKFKEIALRGQELIRKSYSIEQMVRELEKVYDSLD